MAKIKVIKEDKISFETAKLAKKLGYPQDVFNTGWYNQLGSYLGRSDLNIKGQTFSEAYPDEPSFYGCAKTEEHKKEFKLEVYSAPTQALLQKWLRKIYLIEIEVMKSIVNDKIIYMSTIKDFRETHIPKRQSKTLCFTLPKRIDNTYAGATYEEALDEGLRAGLNLIKKQ